MITKEKYINVKMINYYFIFLIKRLFLLTLKYFNIIQLLNEFYLNYLKTYHSISKEYHTKIYNLQKENNTKMKEIINKMDKNESTDFSQIIKFINVLPNIIDLFLENLGYLIKDLEKEMKSHKNFLEEKKNISK